MSGSVQPEGGHSSIVIAPLPTPDELVWAKVPGWQWWPARVLPLAEELRTTDEEQLVLFLVDRTVSRVPSKPPPFHVHYNRFLGATYGNKKLFQAVEEARALLVEGSGGEQALLTYPLPTRDDVRKSGRQLLQFLRQAAVDPMMPLNKLNDQACKRVLHAVRNNRLVTEDKHVIVLAPEQLSAIPPAAVARPAALADSATAVPTASSNPQMSTAAAAAAAAATRERAKRQRKPQAWLQHYGSWADASKGCAGGSSAPGSADASKPPGTAAVGAAARPAAGSKGGSAAAAAAATSKQQPSTSMSKAGGRNTRATPPPPPPPQQQQKVGPHMAMLRKKLQQQLQRAASGPARKPPLATPPAANGATNSKAALAVAATAAETAGRSRAGRPRKRTAAALAAEEQAVFDSSSSSSGSEQLSSSGDDQDDVGSEVSSDLRQELEQQQQWRQRRDCMAACRPGLAQLMAVDSRAAPADTTCSQPEIHRKKQKVMPLKGCGKQGDNATSAAAGAGKRRIAASADSSGNERHPDGAGSIKRRQHQQGDNKLRRDQDSDCGSEPQEAYSSENADLSDDPYAELAQLKHAAAGRGNGPARLHLSSSSAGGSGSCRAHNAAAAAVAAAFGGLGGWHQQKRRQQVRQECNNPQLLHEQQKLQCTAATNVCRTCHQPLPAKVCLHNHSTTLPRHMRQTSQHGVKQVLPGSAAGHTEGEHLPHLDSFSDWQQQQQLPVQQQLYGGGSGGCSSSSMEQCLALLDDDLDYPLDAVSGGAHQADDHTGSLQQPGVQQGQQKEAGHEDQQQLQVDIEGEQTLVEIQAGPHEGLLSPTGQPLHQVAFDCDSEVQPLASTELETHRTHNAAAGVPALAVAACVASAAAAAPGGYSSPLLHRPLSPLLGATLVDISAGGHMTAGVAELLPGLEEDLQHAAAMFGHASPLAKPWDAAGHEHEHDDLLHYQRRDTKDQQAGGVQQGQQCEQQHRIASGVVTPAERAAGDTHEQQQQQHESPSSCSHYAAVQLPAQWVLLHEKGKGPKGVKEVEQAVAAAAAAVRHHHGTRRQSAAAAAAAEAASVAAATAQDCNCGSSVCGKLRGSCKAAVEQQQLQGASLNLSKCDSQQHACKHVDELKSSKQAEQDLLQQLQLKGQQLEEKDEKIAELSSQTAAQAKQLQQQAAELMALKGLLVRIHMGEVSAATITAGLSQQRSEQSTEAASCAIACTGAAAAGATGNTAGTSASANLPSTAGATAAAEPQASAAAESKPDCPALVVQQQLSDLQLLVAALEQQLQDTRSKNAEMTKQQEAQALQLAARLATAEQELTAARQQLAGAALLQLNALRGILPPQRGRMKKTTSMGGRRSGVQVAARCAAVAAGNSTMQPAEPGKPSKPVAADNPPKTGAAAPSLSPAATTTAASASQAHAPAAAVAAAGAATGVQPSPGHPQQQKQQHAGNTITAADVFRRPPQVAMPLTLPGARASSIGSNSSNTTVANMQDLATAIASLTGAAAKGSPTVGGSPRTAPSTANLQTAGSSSNVPAAKVVTATQGAAGSMADCTVAAAAQVAAAMQAVQSGNTIYALQMPPVISPTGAPLLVYKPQLTTLNSLLALNAAHQRMVASLSAGAAGAVKKAATTDTIATTCVLNLAAAGGNSRVGNSKAAGHGGSASGGGRVRGAAAVAGTGLWLGDAPSDAATAADITCSRRGRGGRSIVPRMLAAAASTCPAGQAAVASHETTAPDVPVQAAAAAATILSSTAVKASTRAEAVPMVAAAAARERAAIAASSPPVAVPAALLAASGAASTGAAATARPKAVTGAAAATSAATSAPAAGLQAASHIAEQGAQLPGMVVPATPDAPGKLAAAALALAACPAAAQAAISVAPAPSPAALAAVLAANAQAASNDTVTQLASSSLTPATLQAMAALAAALSGTAGSHSRVAGAQSSPAQSAHIHGSVEQVAAAAAHEDAAGASTSAAAELPAVRAYMAKAPADAADTAVAAAAAVEKLAVAATLNSATVLTG